jgi:nitrosocyanin
MPAALSSPDDQRVDRLRLIAGGREVRAKVEWTASAHAAVDDTSGARSDNARRCTRPGHVVEQRSTRPSAPPEVIGMLQTFVRPVLVALAVGTAAPVAYADDATTTFTVANIEYEGTKVWVPSTLVVKKGTTVKVKLVNNVPTDPNQHGFAIPAYDVAEVVTRGEPKTVEFKADKDGVFPITCQLHPAHVGGQLVVLP